MNIVICGPPCSGKTTLALDSATPGDVIIDFDRIAVELGSPRMWDHTAAIRERAAVEMGRRIAELTTAPSPHTTYIVRGAPEPETRAMLAEQLAAEVWVLDPGAAMCHHRAKVNGRPAVTHRVIGRWYVRYRPWQFDRLLTVSPRVHGPIVGETP